MIRKIVIKNYRVFKDFELTLHDEMNILVGDNDAGKSTLLEAIGVALTLRVGGRAISNDFPPHLVNSDATATYLADISKGAKATPPEVLIELYLSESVETAALKGMNNSAGDEDCPGISVRAHLDPDLSAEYMQLLKDPTSLMLAPTEYYVVDWFSFAGKPINPRTLPASASLIDASLIRLDSGADYYLQRIISENLDRAERADLTRTYRRLREEFSSKPKVQEVNQRLAEKSDDVSSRSLSLAMDVSPRNGWESNVVPHLDDLPFQFIGKGEQNSLKILLALNRRIADAHVVLVEEPENHLSFSSLNVLVSRISAKCAGKQVIITTHSSYVLNKLGLANLVLINRDAALKIEALSPSTQDYFRKLSGYDTLRLVLAKGVILVEGPSDELIVQRAYLDRHGRLPIEAGIDVINVRGLSFKRFLDLAKPLKRRTAVVTDNDGSEPDAIERRYGKYTAEDFISINVGEFAGGSTLEPQLLRANNRKALNEILSKSFATDKDLEDYMIANKTTCALAIFEHDQTIAMPRYIQDAIDFV